jgi:hypothetical protein
MGRGTATSGVFLSHRGLSTIALVAFLIGATIAAGQAAIWIADICPYGTEPVRENQAILFDERFPQNLEDSPPVSLARVLDSEFELKLQSAKSILAEKLLAETLPAPTSETRPAATASFVPVPRPRPLAEAVRQADDRTLLQKLADLLRPRFTLASLTPADSVSNDRPNLASLGYDSLTAVYDISAHTIYMPNGYKLEAHSGFGSLKDDPQHVSERDVGATPPAIYDLKPRENRFHGVQALRMIPVGRSNILGRSGLLAHSYMLGPNGDSNGCVSIKDYEAFLTAFQNGEVKHLLVVARLPDSAQQPPLRS